MNREIKFRAWDKGKSRWLEAGQLLLGYAVAWESQTVFSIKDRNIYAISQYTGLKDKNGVEIFEGDIVEVIQPNSNTTINRTTGESWETKWENKTRSVVKWEDGNNPRWAGMFVWGKGTLEVIGNIYENPELLGGADE